MGRSFYQSPREQAEDRKRFMADYNAEHDRRIGNMRGAIVGHATDFLHISEEAARSLMKIAVHIGLAPLYGLAGGAAALVVYVFIHAAIVAVLLGAAAAACVGALVHVKVNIDIDHE